MPACYLELYEEGEIEIPTCVPPPHPGNLLAYLFSSSLALYRALAYLPAPAED